MVTRMEEKTLRPATNDLLTIEELADLLGVKVSWLYAQTSAKRIPFLKLGGRLRFRRADVERWIEGQVVHPIRPNGSHSKIRARSAIGMRSRSDKSSL